MYNVTKQSPDKRESGYESLHQSPMSSASKLRASVILRELRLRNALGW